MSSSAWNRFHIFIETPQSSFVGFVSTFSFNGWYLYFLVQTWSVLWRLTCLTWKLNLNKDVWTSCVSTCLIQRLSRLDSVCLCCFLDVQVSQSAFVSDSEFLLKAETVRTSWEPTRSVKPSFPECISCQTSSKLLDQLCFQTRPHNVCLDIRPETLVEIKGQSVDVCLMSWICLVVYIWIWRLRLNVSLSVCVIGLVDPGQMNLNQTADLRLSSAVSTPAAWSYIQVLASSTQLLSPGTCPPAALVLHST